MQIIRPNWDTVNWLAEGYFYSVELSEAGEGKETPFNTLSWFQVKHVNIMKYINMILLNKNNFCKSCWLLNWDFFVYFYMKFIFWTNCLVQPNDSPVFVAGAGTESK
jgi:hypothetical protein